MLRWGPPPLLPSLLGLTMACSLPQACCYEPLLVLQLPMVATPAAGVIAGVMRGTLEMALGGGMDPGALDTVGIVPDSV